MCGRYTLSAPGPLLAELFELAAAPELTPRYNIAPTQVAPVIRQMPEGRLLAFLRWGLVPPWSQDPAGGPVLINARADTASEKPAFREALRQRRCLVPADGFFEWQQASGKKQPILFREQHERPFAFAGLWERWVGADGAAIESFTVLTTEPNALVAPVHDRMPVIVPPSRYGLWLDPAVRDPQALREVLVPYPAEAMKAHAVDARVGSPAHDDAGLLEPVEQVQQLRLF